MVVDGGTAQGGAIADMAKASVYLAAAEDWGTNTTGKNTPYIYVGGGISS
jgi:hypothetical protein